MGSKSKNIGTKGTKKGRDTPLPEGMTPDAAGAIRDQFCGKFRETGICIAIFLFALFVVITFSNPGLNMNDEWITVNQVHQTPISGIRLP